ncbi:MAG: NADH-quinone oxidoreductase subunit NuoE family protein [Armatimonadota bacterium]
MPISEDAYRECQEIMSRYPSTRCAMLPVLWVIQREYGYISEEAMLEAADILGVRPVEVMDVVSFYTMFHTRRPGKHVIAVCQTLSCALLGARTLLAHLQDRLGIRPGETTPDGMFTLEVVECLGACADAPVVAVDWYYYYRMTEEKLDRLIDSLRRGEEPQQERRDFRLWTASPNET